MTTEQLKQALAICPIDCEIIVASESGTVCKVKGAMPVPFPGKPAFVIEVSEPEKHE